MMTPELFNKLVDCLQYCKEQIYSSNNEILDHITEENVEEILQAVDAAWSADLL